MIWDLVEHGRRGDDASFVFVEYAAAEGCEVDDEDAWAVANPALGDFLYLDALRATLRTTREADLRRYRSASGLSTRTRGCRGRRGWRALTCGRSLRTRRWCSGFDGSYSGDAAAIVAVEIGEVPHLDVVRFWEHPGVQVPIVDVEDTLREACKWWRVQRIVADPFRWARSLQLLAEEGLAVEEFPQSPQRMTPQPDGSGRLG